MASLFVESIGGGVSLRQITEEIRAMLSEDPHRWRASMRSFMRRLGASWMEAMEERFDSELAHESLQFFDSALNVLK